VVPSPVAQQRHRVLPCSPEPLRQRGADAEDVVRDSDRDDRGQPIEVADRVVASVRAWSAGGSLGLFGSACFDGSPDRGADAKTGPPPVCSVPRIPKLPSSGCSLLGQVHRECPDATAVRREFRSPQQARPADDGVRRAPTLEITFERRSRSSNASSDGRVGVSAATASQRVSSLGVLPACRGRCRSPTMRASEHPAPAVVMCEAGPR
jgi:hypothetical protein